MENKRDGVEEFGPPLEWWNYVLGFGWFAIGFGALIWVLIRLN
jgi:hypothetical protein